MSNIVYIVLIGENYEGCEILNVYSTKELANNYVTKYITDYNQRYNKPFKWDNNSNTWISGCQYIMIQKWKIDDPEV